ncbi:MAG: RNA-binding transcriptional accessory protein [Provencibacterium sp.]|jgi:uncharacterized protein|nr:RNA-binding transcriptional accessory protein [Provencibacterium sp.]
MDIVRQIAEELGLAGSRVQAAVELIDAGNTIPFIARYRKEATGGLDDNELRDLEERLGYLRALEKRREEILSLIDQQGKLTDELRASVAAASTLAALEDLYRPYRPKRKTRASVARERGLAPLAAFLLAQDPHAQDPAFVAERYVNPDQEVPDAGAALQGAMDILAEQFSDDADIRGRLRAFLQAEGMLEAEGDEEKESVYTAYCHFSEPLRKIAGHRVLAVNRGEREEFLKVSIRADGEKALALLRALVLKRKPSPCREYVEAAACDGWQRLLFPSLEREARAALTEKAEKAAIHVFAQNLRQLLLQPPLKGRVVLGLDPAYRTGCKLAVVDPTGKVLDTAVVYPTPPQNKKEEAAKKIADLCRKHRVEVVSIGNGTATGESEAFIAELIAAHPELGLSYMVVSEAGASVYSASKLAAEEFPQFDVSLRSAVSIARRLQDPLAELVKIDPKAIGVGQYQHDMPQKELSEALGGVVEGAVNSVGVDLNTASHALLKYIAGINASTAQNIVSYREENGRFHSRQELLKVKGLGKKAFLQCAGFLRVSESENILDNTAVHPESYAAADGLLSRCGYAPENVREGKLGDLPAQAERLGIDALCSGLGVGEPTLRDIIEELMKPGRDMRDSLPPPLLRQGAMDLKDLREGMTLSGTVRNIVDFGAFVDIGVHQDGLVHISQLSERYVSHPLDAVHVGDVVKVKVLSVDPARKRISLTMRGVQ